MTDPATAFVWVWLPGETEPVVAGRLDDRGTVVTFAYGRSYLDRPRAIPLYLPELPLRTGEIPPASGSIAGCVADAGPDAWGRRVIEHSRAIAAADLPVLTYLLESGSDRIGALDFQASPAEYVPRAVDAAPLSELAEAAARVEKGEQLTPALDRALLHGSEIGGARPKAVFSDGTRRLIAKFSSTTDTDPVVKAEYVAMELARRAGIAVAPVELVSVLGKDVLLVDRFDRTNVGARRMMLTALTILELHDADGIAGRYATYPGRFSRGRVVGVARPRKRPPGKGSCCCRSNRLLSQEGTSEMQCNSKRPRLLVTGDGKDVVGHAGARVLCDLADELGLTSGLSAAMALTKRRRRGHDRGQVLVDLAVMLADGFDAISDLAVLRDQPALFGEVASVSTAWRTLEAVDEAALARIAAARADARATAWAAGADPGFYVIDLDATLLDSHSDKEGAAPNYKHGFGFHPLMAYLDATGEALAAKLRPGNAGSNTAVDHVEVLDLALGQLPVDPHEREVIVRTDSAALTHGFIDACRERGVRFAVGHDLTAPIRTACLCVPKRRWAPAVTADGTDERDNGEVAEITDLVDLSRWPEHTRMIVRREQPHPGAQLTFTDHDGHRFQVFITDLDDPDIGYLEALHRGRGRAEKRICDAKTTGLANLPSANFAINTAWVQLVLVAQDLLAWTKLLCLDGDLARAEPKRLRYCLFHAAGIIVRSGRRTRLRIANGWPWANELVNAFTRVHALPLPA